MSTDICASLFIYLLIIFICEANENYNANIEKLKPCFERYIGQRLIDLVPYHSEWRMKTPENCLLFCALSASRCRSIVHDMFQHICHYFLDDGREHTRITRGMVYLRVTHKGCLDQFLSRANHTLLSSELEFPEKLPLTSVDDSVSDFTTIRWPIVAFGNSLIHVPADGQALTPTPYFNNPKKLEKFGEFDDSEHRSTTPTTTHIIHITTTSTTNTAPTAAATTTAATAAATTTAATATNAAATAPIAPAPTTFSQIHFEEEDNEHKIYDEIIEMMPSETNIPTFQAFNASKQQLLSFNNFPTTEKFQISDASPPAVDALFFVGNAHKFSQLNSDKRKMEKIGSNGDDNLSKLLKMMSDEIRRSPKKITSFASGKVNEEANVIKTWDETKSIADKQIPIPSIKSISMTLSTKYDDKMERILTPACRSDEHDVWLLVENAILQTIKPQKKTSAESYQSCKTKCNLITNAGKNCLAFTYHEVERKCVIHINNELAVSTLAFMPSSKADFSDHTATKFCYPESLTVLDNCSEFIAFGDYTLDVEPREIFNEMPEGYEGLHACIELCILAPNFHCKSATFDTTIGQCLLRDEDSLTSPQYFREHHQIGLIYFENGCEQFEDKHIVAETQIERVPVEQLNNVEHVDQLSGDAYIES